MKKCLFICLAALAALISGIRVQAQNFSIDWFTIDGGGGSSTGGGYALNGTIGQPDAGVMSGGPYVLTGGFWSIINLIQTPGAPFLSAIHTNSNVTVSWDLPATSFILEQAMSLASPPPPNAWIQVPFPYQTNATKISITVPSPSGNGFYRLRKP